MPDRERKIQWMRQYSSPHGTRAVTSISIFISGSWSAAAIIVAAGRALAKAADVTGQQAGHSLGSGTM
jgi:hypothetical protein